MASPSPTTATNTVIGTDGDGIDDANEGNLISGNIGFGVIPGIGTTVAGNLIGTDVTGLAPLGNAGGIGNGTSVTIGTDGDGVSDALERNVISGNTEDGLEFNSGNTNSVIAGNIIGLGIDGTTPIGNGIVGVQLNGASGFRIGTDGNGSSDHLEANIISSNSLYGVQILGTGATNNSVAGNLIGTDVQWNATTWKLKHRDHRSQWSGKQYDWRRGRW